MKSHSEHKYRYRRIIAETEDVSVFRQIRLRALKDSPHAFMSSYDSARARPWSSWKEQVEASATGRERITCLCFEGGHAVGIAALYASGQADPSMGEVIQVWVDPQHRQNGIARHLMLMLTEWAHTHGYSQLYATIHKENAEVLPFYNALGFLLDAEATVQAPERDLIIRKILDNRIS